MSRGLSRLSIAGAPPLAMMKVLVSLIARDRQLNRMVHRFGCSLLLRAKWLSRPVVRGRSKWLRTVSCVLRLTVAKLVLKATQSPVGPLLTILCRLRLDSRLPSATPSAVNRAPFVLSRKLSRLSVRQRVWYPCRNRL